MVPLARAAARRVLDAAGAPARRRLKSIRDHATRRGAVDITHIARASSLACRCRRIRDRRRACGPMRVALTALTALAARAARTAGHGRNSPRIGACRRIADAIGEYAPARQGGARRDTPRRGKALAEPVAGASFAAATRGHFAAVLRHAWILLSKRVPAGGRSTKTFAVA